MDDGRLDEIRSELAAADLPWDSAGPVIVRELLEEVERWRPKGGVEEVSPPPREDELRRDLALALADRDKYHALAYRAIERKQEAERAGNEALGLERERRARQLVAISVAAASNTRESAAANRLTPRDAGYTAAYSDVVVAVDREMDARERADKAERLAEEFQAKNLRLLEDVGRMSRIVARLGIAPDNAERRVEDLLSAEAAQATLAAKRAEPTSGRVCPTCGVYDPQAGDKLLSRAIRESDELRRRARTAEAWKAGALLAGSGQPLEDDGRDESVAVEARRRGWEFVHRCDVAVMMSRKVEGAAARSAKAEKKLVDEREARDRLAAALRAVVEVPLYPSRPIQAASDKGTIANNALVADDLARGRESVVDVVVEAPKDRPAFTEKWRSAPPSSARIDQSPSWPASWPPPLGCPRCGCEDLSKLSLAPGVEGWRNVGGLWWPISSWSLTVVACRACGAHTEPRVPRDAPPPERIHV